MIPEHSTLHTRPCHSCKLLISVCNQGRNCAQGHPGRGPSRGPPTLSIPTQFQPKTFGPVLVSPMTTAAAAWCLLAAAWCVARATCHESEPLASCPAGQSLVNSSLGSSPWQFVAQLIRHVSTRLHAAGNLSFLRVYISSPSYHHFSLLFNTLI